jgi:hypothetical protein
LSVEVTLRPTISRPFQSVLVSGARLGPATNFLFFLRFSFRQLRFVIYCSLLFNFISYNESHTNINDTLYDFNSIHPNIQYTIEKQTNNELNYVDITIENTNNTFTFNIYRKPTTTDLIIHNDSCHPTEHKHSAIRYMINNRMNTYPISTESKHNKTQLINTILHGNGYPAQILTN